MTYAVAAPASSTRRIVRPSLDLALELFCFAVSVKSPLSPIFFFHGYHLVPPPAEIPRALASPEDATSYMSPPNSATEIVAPQAPQAPQMNQQEQTVKDDGVYPTATAVNRGPRFPAGLKHARKNGEKSSAWRPKLSPEQSEGPRVCSSMPSMVTRIKAFGSN